MNKDFEKGWQIGYKEGLADAPTIIPTMRNEIVKSIENYIILIDKSRKEMFEFRDILKKITFKIPKEAVEK